MPQFFCLHCGQHIDADNAMAGMDTTCPTCSGGITVPQVKSVVALSPPRQVDESTNPRSDRSLPNSYWRTPLVSAMLCLWVILGTTVVIGTVSEGNPFLSLFFANLTALLPAIFFGRRLDMRLRQKEPALHGYKWGYTHGIVQCSKLPWPFLFGYSFIAAGKPEDLSFAVGVVLWFALDPILGWGIIKRNRWAFLVHTVLSFNVFWWGINGSYLHRRWKEMGMKNG